MSIQTQKPSAVRATQVKIAGGYWGERQTVNRESTLPAIHKQLSLTGQLDALNLLRTHPNDGHVVYMFWDSDFGKYLEAVGLSLENYPDPALEAQTDELIDRMERAQQPDGYLNTYFTVLKPQARWTNLRDWHELYNAGHLIEGAIAYSRATGKPKALQIMSRYADLIDRTFGREEGKRRGYCGHPEIELALVKLYHATGEERYFKLAQYFIDERGQQPHYYDMEAAERGDDPSKFWAKTYHYCQAHVPIREQQTATGHSVRATYLYSAVADIAAATGDQSLIDASLRFWDDLTEHQMYITGGLGPAHANEGFTFAYDFPNETAYAETCASIALVFWAQRMFQLDPNSRYINVLERALYNGVMSGVSYDGTQFYYANPLTSYPHVNPFEHWSGIQTAEHYRRADWYFCPCCPPNLARLVANIGEYFYAVSADTVYVNLYNQNNASLQVNGAAVSLAQQTNYPWDGAVSLSVNPAAASSFTVALRIPDWCRNFSISVNGEAAAVEMANGYARLTRQWSANDSISLNLAMPVERIVANPHIRQDAGNIALQRGPVIYCLEGADNGTELANVTIPQTAHFSAQVEASLLGGVGIITGDALRIEPKNWTHGLYQPQSAVEFAQTPFTFKAIPYAFWANREAGEMRVWVREA